MPVANSRNMPQWREHATEGLQEMDDLRRRYLLHYRVFAVEHLPDIALQEIEFRELAILQRKRPDVFWAVYPDCDTLLDDSPDQFTVR